MYIIFPLKVYIDQKKKKSEIFQRGLPILSSYITPKSVVSQNQIKLENLHTRDSKSTGQCLVHDGPDFLLQLLRKVLDDNNLQHTRIVAPDGGFGIVNDINKDPDLAKAIDYIG